LAVVAEPGDHDRSVDRLVAGARRTLEVTMYELADPTVERLLVAARRRGVRVRVLLDRAGAGAAVNRSAARRLAAAGIAVRWGPGTVLVHQKTAVADGLVAAVMTGNLTGPADPDTRDFVVLDRDPRAVSAIRAVFAADWRGRPVTGRRPAAGLVWSPGSLPTVLDLIRSARRTLAVENEEMDDRAVIRALGEAARHGVRVEVTMTADPRWDAAWSALAAAGVRVSVYPEAPGTLFIHAKAVVVDGTWALVGSANFSPSGLGRNRELAVLTSAPSVVGPLSRWLAADAARGSPFDR
jgi:phosphatidylserine/phosphatidylglycerophosphate/cardiolipin synthase-like enzyme